jgi:hypothetical protein
MLTWLYFDLLTLLLLIEYCVPLYKVVTQAHDPVHKLMLLWNLISSTIHRLVESYINTPQTSCNVVEAKWDWSLKFPYG